VVGTNLDYHRPTLPANAEANTCFLDLSRRHGLPPDVRT